LNYDDISKKEIKSEPQKVSNIVAKEELPVNNVKMNDNDTTKSELTNEVCN